MYVTGANRGKTYASKARNDHCFWFSFSLVEVTRVLPSEPITERSEANLNQTRNYFQHSIDNRSIEENNKELIVINVMTITYDINDDD